MTEPATTQAETTETPAGDAPAGAPASAGPETEDVLEALRDVVDPELGINVVDLGLVTSAACPLTDVIEDQARAALDGLVNDFRINWVWMPPWGPDKITEDGREQLRALGFNV
jgi:metal-sulfur cluster biosynthetic enzyme